MNANQDPTQFKNRVTRRTIILAVAVLAVAFVAFIWGPRLGATDNWNVVMTVATLLAVIAALFLDDIKDLLHSPKIQLRVGDDLLDVGARLAPIAAAHDLRTFAQTLCQGIYLARR